MTASVRHGMAIMACDEARRLSRNRLMRIITSFSLGLTTVFAILLLAGCSSLPQSTDFTGAATGSLGGIAEPGSATPAASGSDAPRAEGMLRLAADIEARGEKGTALTFYERAASSSGGDVAVHLQVADAYLRLGYPVNAANAYRVVLAKDPDNARALLGLGTAHVKSGQLDEGLSLLTRAAPLVKTASAFDRLGVAHVLAGRPREALASFEQAYAIDSRDLDIATNLALAAALAGEHDKAVSMMKQAAGAPSASKHHKRNLVLVLGIAGRGSEARGLASDLRGDDVQALLQQANAIRALSSPKARAMALGTASSSTQ